MGPLQFVVTWHFKIRLVIKIPCIFRKNEKNLHFHLHKKRFGSFNCPKNTWSDNNYV